MNVGLTERKPNPDPDGTFSNMPISEFIGRYVQLSFTFGCGKHYEYMWVKVTGSCDEDDIIVSLREI